jgi:diguanylate cyclase (GGDEF)-like protein
MQPAILGHEAERLSALKRYNILDTAPDDSFDRIARLAKMVLQTPIALVSLIDKDRQWLKSTCGFDAAEIPRSISLCAHAIQQGGALIVEDARENPVFRDNPMVVGAPHIRFYIGIPLRTHDGHNVGTLSAMDIRPRKPSADQVSALRDLARLAVDELELRQIGTTDNVAGVLTPHGFQIAIDREMNRVLRYQNPLSLIAVEIEDLEGHAERDLILQIVGDTLLKTLRSVDFAGRVGVAQFIVALPETGSDGAQVVARRIQRKIAEIATSPEIAGANLSAHTGVSTYLAVDETWETTLARAKAALKEAKNVRPVEIPLAPIGAAYPSPLAASHARLA